MSERTDLIYSCDGSLWGILCCIFESYTRHETPSDILTDAMPTLFPTRYISTDEVNAMRVYRSLSRISHEVQEWVSTAYLACPQGREQLLYRFIRLAYECGARVTSMLTNRVVCDTFKAVRAARNEAHLFCGFVRFSEHQGILAAKIEPKSIVLPLIQAHFTSRFPEETFLIFDQTHGMALFYRPYEAVIEEVERLELAQEDETEQAFRTLWRGYYDAIAIEGRYNPRCRMGHMPKRFWKLMTEMQPDLRSIDQSHVCGQKRIKTVAGKMLP